jgi:sialic acid synthase SpsE
MKLQLGKRSISPQEPVFFIADIASNHGGDLQKAKDLIHACAESGVDAVKMQNFTADTIVSDLGFEAIKGLTSHQSLWKKSVFESYNQASIPIDWTLELSSLAERLGIEYLTSPYSIELTRAVAPYVCALKLGSGDITWHEHIREMARQGKPLIIASGASTLEEVKSAMQVALAEMNQILLLQCNTNYSATKQDSIEKIKSNYSSINLSVLKTYSSVWPGLLLGLSDHTVGSMSVIAAVGLFGCCVVEKHFTLDSSQEGQDHSFSMMPSEWQKMVKEVATLRADIAGLVSYEQRYHCVAQHVEYPSLLDVLIGDGQKRVEANELATVVVQRRAIRAKNSLSIGQIIKRTDLTMLRPCPEDALAPWEMDSILGRSLMRDIQKGDVILRHDCN